MFKDTPKGQTHSHNDGCGEKAHNDPEIQNGNPFNVPTNITPGLEVTYHIPHESNPPKEKDEELISFLEQSDTVIQGLKEGKARKEATKEEWEGEFDYHFKSTDKNEVGYVPIHRTDEIKSFIRTLLSKERERMAEEVKKKKRPESENDYILDEIAKKSFNSGLETAISIILPTKEKKI